MIEFIEVGESGITPNLVDPYEAEFYDWMASIDWCAHGTDRADRSCVECFGDGDEYIAHCPHCSKVARCSNVMTWHKHGRCMKCTNVWALMLKRKGLTDA